MFEKSTEEEHRIKCSRRVLRKIFGAEREKLSLGPREGNWHENGEKLRTMNFISRALHQILYRL